MSTAKTCKKCPQFIKERGWCMRHGKHTTPWQDWCKERVKDWEEWRLSIAEPNIGEGKL